MYAVIKVLYYPSNCPFTRGKYFDGGDGADCKVNFSSNENLQLARTKASQATRKVAVSKETLL